ncbi:MAG TPA: GNAT family N-acetyltransferase [Kiloniellales bacterium]|nr:GNAT family N-acetyltransferase [Kiloniellales bacterium]
MTAEGPVEVRRLAPDDGLDVTRLCGLLSLHEGKPPPRFTVESYAREILAPDAYVSGFIARRGVKALGYTLFHPAYDSDAAERGSYMVDLFVVEEARGQGIGRALMGAVARDTERFGGVFLWWSAKTYNQVARRFYGGVGEMERDVNTWACFGEPFRRLLGEAQP